MRLSRLTGALIAYLALGVLAFETLSDPRIRAATLLILALFAFKTWVRRKDVMHPDAASKPEADGLAESRELALSSQRPSADGRFEPM
jgi:hypothetical protein